jgi:hypothetical protein
MLHYSKELAWLRLRLLVWLNHSAGRFDKATPN